MPALALLAAVLAAAPVLHVDASAALGGDGTAARPFTKVGEALARAPDGAEVRLEPGLYEETLTLNRPVTLVGAGKVVLAAPPGAQTALAVAAPVALAKLTVQGGRVGLDVRNGAVTLDRVQVTGQAEAAVACGAGATCTLRESRLDCTLPGAVGLRGAGTYHLHGLSISGPFRRGVDLEGGSLRGEGLTASGPVTGMQLVHAEVDLREVSLDGLRGDCIFAAGGRVALSEVVLANCDVGVEAREQAQLALRHVILARCHRDGLALVQSRLELSDALLDGPARDAAVMVLGGEAHFRDVLIREPGVDGILARLAKVELQEVTVVGAREDRGHTFGNALFSFDSQLAGQGLDAIRCEGPAVEVQLGSGRLADLEVEQGGDAALALEHKGALDVDGLLGTGGSGAGVACIEGGRSRLRAPWLRGYAGGAWLVDCSCKLQVAPADPALLRCGSVR